jgi:hypothetical protein
MALLCVGTQCGRLVSSGFGLSYCTARTTTGTTPGHGPVLLQMHFQAQRQYLMLMIHGFDARRQNRKLV